MAESFASFLELAGKHGFDVGYEEMFGNGESEVILYREDGIVLYANSHEKNLHTATLFAEVPYEWFDSEQMMAIGSAFPIDSDNVSVTFSIDDDFEFKLERFLDNFTPNKIWSPYHECPWFVNYEEEKAKDYNSIRISQMKIAKAVPKLRRIMGN